MGLTFKSSTPEQRVLIERDPNGRQRVCRATQADYNSRMWTLRLDHPSGETWHSTFYGNGSAVNVALAQLMVDREADYLADKARGDRPRETTRDLTVRVDPLGQDVSAPLRGYLKR